MNQSNSLESVSVQTVAAYARTGDVLLVRGKTTVIRYLTGESVSHVALIVKEAPNMWVHEYLVGGYRISRLEDWFKAERKDNVLWGVAPPEVREAEYRLGLAVIAEGNKKYSVAMLLSVFLSQFGIRLPFKGHVCSTFIQEVWSYALGSFNKKKMDPGDFIFASESLRRVTSKEDTNE